MIIGKKRDVSSIYHLVFAEVLDVLLVGGVAYFATHVLNILGYSEYRRAYEVVDIASSVSFVHPSSLLFHQPQTTAKTASEMLIKPRNDLYPLLVD